MDDFAAEPTLNAAPVPGAQAWLGVVVPKRHARRAVTRTLLKRQIRAAALRLDADEAPLQAGLWVVRLRAPFDRAAFPSAASDALRGAARGELDALMLQAARKLRASVVTVAR